MIRNKTLSFLILFFYSYRRTSEYSLIDSLDCIPIPLLDRLFKAVQHSLAVPRLSYGEGNGTPLQYSCLENSMDGGAWQAAVHGVTKSRTRLNDFAFTFHFHALEEEMATHSSVLAWRIPGTGSLVGCRLWSRRVGHD